MSGQIMEPLKFVSIDTDNNRMYLLYDVYRESS